MSSPEVEPDARGHRRRRWRSFVYLSSLAALVVLCLLPLFQAPFERDQGTYATIARGWTRGALPYRDLWDNKGPLLFLWYVGSFACLGENVVAPRVAAALAAALCVPFVWGAARRLFGEPVARRAALVFALSFANVYLQVTANGEVFMLLPLCAGFWAFVVAERKGSWLWHVWAGLLTSLAVFTRQSALLTFLAYGAWITALFLRRPAERRRQLAAAAALAVGAILGALPFVAYFAAHRALRDLWFAMFGFNLSWVMRGSHWLKLAPTLLLAPAALLGGLILWLAAVVGLWALWRRRDRAAGLVLSLVAASEAAAQLAGHGAAHYAIQLLPGVALAGAFGLPRLRQWWRGGGAAVRAGLAVAGFVTVGAAGLAYARPDAEGRFLVQYGFGDYARDALDAPAIARAVAALSPPGACIYDWGRSSQIYFLADRPPCSAVFYDRPFEVDESRVAGLVEDLARRKPAVIVLTGKMTPPAELMRLMARSYRYVGEVEYAQLFRRTRRSRASRATPSDSTP